jgi:transposase
VKRHEVDAGRRPGTTTSESAQIKALKKGNAGQRANENLKAAAGLFAAEFDRRHTRS